MNDDDETPAINASTLEMAHDIAEIVNGENIVLSFKALEHVIVDLIANNCVDLDAAFEVIETMNTNLTTLIESFDAMQLCVWNEQDKLN